MTITYTHRTPQGHKARIICADFQHSTNNSYQPRENLCTIAAVLDSDITGAESLVFLTQDLRKTATSAAPYLTEYNPWQDVAIDTPVWCRDFDDDEWEAHHFAGLDSNGLKTTWSYGMTSHTAAMDNIFRRPWWRQMTLTNPNANIKHMDAMRCAKEILARSNK